MQVIAGQESKDALREILAMLRITGNPQVLFATHSRQVVTTESQTSCAGGIRFKDYNALGASKWSLSGNMY
jgi:hypothetical protein